MTPELPENWHAKGQLPDFDPAERGRFTTKDLLGLNEDLWSATSPGGRFEIDVGWYPQGEATGAFRAMLVEGDWNQPVDEINTRSRRQLIDWIAEATRGSATREAIPTRAHR